MSWRVVCASEVGTSHVAVGRDCEDSCWAQVGATANGMPFLQLFVADGAGSASNGGEGADLAIQAAADFVDKKLRQPEFGLSDELATQCVMHVRDKLYGRADALGLKARDLACTFLGVLSCKLGTLVLQIGDGGIVLDVGQGLEVPVVPMSGEYANMTHFISDEDAVSQMVTKTYPGIASRIAVFSDGLQRLALNMAENTAHEPFFDKFFKVLGASSPEQDDQLHGALVRFLQSPAVNDRTDDDKTLALAVLTE
ncbi:PP2C family serine/threonine-protein phosphatase [Rhodoferax sp. U11-2br]|uniref:PP2C family serine/threonine-protein phosphatase n=1 Tax=Rhodoferax sp. U11-2br TaxID=2838878 RepID=UPI001BE6F704|nr:PP2C family serine/threonine-protein phosphatase [Rhodoferax sp. U11-2br]MBT3067952.1 protein phosphatase 2C domain-containing protein [Rhodoferax sp. U11-2br]